MTNKKVLSFIIPFCRKNETRLPALYALFDCIKAQDFKITDANNVPTKERAFEFIFVEQADTEWYEPIDTKGIADKHIIVKSYTDFNKSWLMNIAAKEASTNLLVFCDADMLFGKEYLYYVNIWREAQRPIPKFFVGWDWIMKLPGKSEPVARMVRSTALTAGGIFWINKDFYWEVGGMNENYFGYGGEDNDFWVRANKIMGKFNLKNVLNAPYPLVHTYHDDAVPSPKRIEILDKTLQFVDIVTDRLKKANLGNKEQPTLIKIDDLVLNKPSYTSKEGQGLI